MRPPLTSIAPTMALGFLLAGCGLFGGRPTPTATPPVPIESDSATPTGGADGEPTETAGFVETPSAGATAMPGDDLPSFSCSLPVTGSATIPRAQIVDVRVGTHAGYDRVVFEFAAGLPEYEVDSTSPPFTRDASGMPFEVGGSDHLQVILRGGTKQSETGGSTYSGPREFRPDFPQLVELEEGGDFEAQSTWIIGRRSAACIRVFALASPSRLVIDLEQP